MAGAVELVAIVVELAGPLVRPQLQSSLHSFSCNIVCVRKTEFVCWLLILINCYVMAV